MKDTDYTGIIEMTWMGGGFIPENQAAHDLTERCARGEVVAFKEITNRDLSFHKAYFSLLGYIWDYLPNKFKTAVPKDKFYIFLKHLRGEYDVVFKFQDGTQMVQYHSISFGRMSQKKFEEYVAEQMPFIYEEVIRPLFSEEIAKNIIDTIEQDYLSFLAELP